MHHDTSFTHSNKAEEAQSIWILTLLRNREVGMENTLIALSENVADIKVYKLTIRTHQICMSYLDFIKPCLSPQGVVMQDQ